MFFREPLSRGADTAGETVRKSWNGSIHFDVKRGKNSGQLRAEQWPEEDTLGRSASGGGGGGGNSEWCTVVVNARPKDTSYMREHNNVLTTGALLYTYAAHTDLSAIYWSQLKYNMYYVYTVRPCVVYACARYRYVQSVHKYGLRERENKYVYASCRARIIIRKIKKKKYKVLTNTCVSRPPANDSVRYFYYYYYIFLYCVICRLNLFQIRILQL